jgi:ribose transport system substrate-binding protein
MKLKSLRWVVLAAFAGLAVCSSASAEDPVSKKQPAKHRVAFVTNQQADFWNIAEKGCRAAEKDFDVEVDVRMPDTANATRQKQIVEDLIVNGVEALAISPIDATNQAAMLNDWCRKIPVITHDSDAPQSNRLVYIGMDNYAAGRMVGKLV